MNAPLAPAPDVRTTCPYCGVGCGVAVRHEPSGAVRIAGDAAHPANFGRLCSKGSALGETLGLETRLLRPLVRGADGALKEASFDAALDRVAEGLRATRARHGPQAIAFYLSGQLLTEDYYAANKLAKGYLGTANVDTNSRLCMASSVAGHTRAFGADTVPGCYEDLDVADLIVLVGSNAAWCHPILYRRIQEARWRRGARLVVIDPRRTPTADEADLFLPLAQGTDAVLFQGLLAHLAQAGRVDEAFVRDHTQGFAAARAAAALWPDARATAHATGLNPDDVARFFALVADTERTVTCYSQGVNQSRVGTDKVNAILNCHLATGRIGRPGMGPLSLTGQPNAMGGREVGGLANQLAAHMGFSPEEIDRVRRFWDAPHMATREGLKAVDLFAAIGRGEVRALWVMGTNPAVSLPRAGAARAALEKLDLFVLSDTVIGTDTFACRPHIVLPAAAWGEKDGTVTNSERRMSRQRPFLAPPGEARPDWQAIAGVAQRLGHGAAFAWNGPADIFREHAALSAFENGGTRDFDLSGLAQIDTAAYDALEPVQWPVRRGTPPHGTARLFGDGRFHTADRRARFIVPAPVPAPAVSDAFPFLLNTGRLRDQWHTMTRTGLSPRLSAHAPAPVLALNPADAAAAGIEAGALVEVVTPSGRAILLAALDPGQPRGTLFAPIHWSRANASHGAIGALVHDATDPVSGQPDLKATPAAIRAVPAPFTGFLIARTPLAPPPDAWWARVAVKGGFGWQLVWRAPPEHLPDWAAAQFSGDDGADFLDAGAGHYRAAAFDAQSRLAFALVAGPRGATPSWDGMLALFAAEGLSPSDRRLLLSARKAGAEMPTGPMVCACHGVPHAAIAAAARAGSATPEAIGRRVKAGTNCGSCLPEIRRILEGAGALAAAD